MESEKPLILVVDNSRAITGALNAMRNTTNSLRPEFDFRYILPTGSTARAVLEQDGYTVHELPFVEISRRKLDLLRYVPMLLLNGWHLHQLAHQNKAVIVHINDFYNLTAYIAKLLSLGQLRVVTHVRFLPQSLLQPLARSWRWLSERCANRVICVSEAVCHYFSPSPRVQVIFDPIPRSERYPVSVILGTQPRNTIRLLYLSNYIPGKGQNFAVEAFQQAYAHDKRLRLTFIGGDMGMERNKKFRQNLETVVQANGLADVVDFDNFVIDVERVIKDADIVLNFSEAESFSLTCLDALYYGTPLIATDCGGPAELFENNKSGFLVPNRDVDAMASAIITLATNQDLRNEFAKASREFVRHKFRPQNTYIQLGEVYKMMLVS